MGVAKNFDGTGSRAAPGGSIETYAWDFGDGGTGSGPTPTHTYDMAGSPTVTLTVTDDAGMFASDDTIVVIGDGEPNPDDRLVDVVTLGNVGGSDAADLAVLDAVLANRDQLSARIHVRDGGTGEEIYQVDLTGSVQSVALETVMGGAGPLLAVLQRKDNGNVQVVFLNANDGTAAGNVQYFNETWAPIDILAVRDAGGPGIAGIGVLAEKPSTGLQAIEVHTVDDGALVNRVFYFDDTWTATAAIDLGEFNGNGRSEMAVLATNNTGEHAVQTRDALSGAKISQHSFLSPIVTVIGLADSADVSGNEKPELIVLGNKSTGNPAQARDVKTGELISKVNTFGGDWSGLGIRGMDDVDGNSSPEYVVMVSNGVDNSTAVQVRDVPFGNLTMQTGFIGPAYDPRDVEVLADVSGNAIQEVVVAGLRPDTLSIRVQLRDALTGMKLRNIDIN